MYSPCVITLIQIEKIDTKDVSSQELSGSHVKILMKKNILIHASLVKSISITHWK